MLFAYLRSIARDCTDAAELIQQAFDFNAQCAPPQSSAEVLTTVRSVWKLLQEGRCIQPGGGAVAFFTAAEVNLMHGRPDVLMLMTKIKLLHGARSEPFALVPESSTEIFGLSRRRLRAARQEALDLGLLRCINQGGRGKHDTATFAIATPAIEPRRRRRSGV